MSDSDAEWDAEVLISACLPPSLRASGRIRSDCTAAAGSMPGVAAGSMSPSGVYGEVDWLSASAAACCHRSSSLGPCQSPRMLLSSSSGRPGSVVAMPDPGPIRAISLDVIATVSIPPSLSHFVLASNVRSLVFFCHFIHIVPHCNMLQCVAQNASTLRHVFLSYDRLSGVAEAPTPASWMSASPKRLV